MTQPPLSTLQSLLTYFSRMGERTTPSYPSSTDYEGKSNAQKLMINFIIIHKLSKKKEIGNFFPNTYVLIGNTPPSL